MNRITYATDGDLTLYPLSDDDRDNYFRLKLQVTDIPILYTNKELAEVMWRSAFDLTDSNFAIYKGAEYCGNIVLQNDGSDMPEIGIELLEDKRGQGIGAKAVRLFAEQYHVDNNISCFLMRTHEKNIRCRRMLEKLNLVSLDTEIDNNDELIASFENATGKSLSEDVKNILKGTTAGETIIRFRLDVQ